jgi:predicted transcriptional regulator
LTTTKIRVTRNSREAPRAADRGILEKASESVGVDLMKQNITLSLDKEVIRKGKILAARKETSISKLLAESLKHAVQKEESYEAAKRNALNTLKRGFRLGGRMNWRREDLYER